MDDFGGTDFPEIDYSTRLFDSPIVQERFKPGFGDSVDVPMDYAREDDCVAFDIYAVPASNSERSQDLKPAHTTKYNDVRRFSTKWHKR
jgi:hypothetical protein